MITKDQLLKDREELHQQIELVEEMLELRFGWKPPVNEKQSAGKDVKIAPTVKEVGPLPYGDLAKEWVSGASGKVTTRDFQEWLSRKYGADRINRTSLAGPLRRLAEEGYLTLLKNGVGRAPTVYHSGNQLDAKTFRDRTRQPLNEEIE